MTRVLVIGEAIVDVLSTGEGEIRRPGGSPLNVACGLALLGRRTSLLTYIADDSDGRAIAARAAAAGVRLLPESFAAERTGTAIARVDSTGAPTYSFDLAWRPVMPPIITADAVHVGSLGAFMQPGAATVSAFVDSLPDSILLFFDPNIRAALIGNRQHARPVFERLASRSTAVKLSDEDAEWLYPGISANAVIDSLLSHGAGVVVVTRGASGALLATSSSRVAVDAVSSAVVDTVGAGDCFMSSLIDRLLEVTVADLGTDQLVAIGREAAHAAAITVSRQGSQPPSREELDRALTAAGAQSLRADASKRGHHPQRE